MFARWVRRRSGFLVVSLLVALLGGLGCAPFPSSSSEPNEPPRVTRSRGWLAMGTFFEADLRVPPVDRARAEAWLDWARDEVARREAIYSRHDPESELSALNRGLAGAKGTLIPISSALEEILKQSIWHSEETKGRFDPSVGPLVDVWWAAGSAGVAPSAEVIEGARQRTGLRGIEWHGSKTLRVREAGTRIDLDGLSKGVVLDALAADFVERFPSSAALLSFGPSSVVAIGRPEPNAEGWRLALRSRGGSEVIWDEVVLRDQALSVSSSLGSTVEIAGKQYAHVIDPRTGWPVADQVEAAVVGPSAAQADAWSTALLLMGCSPQTERLLESARLAAHAIREARGGRAGAEIRTSGWPGRSQSQRAGPDPGR